MSTENKKKVLLGFGAFAVVLIAVLAIWRPPAFRSEDASGSIGAVQKHHAPQITPQDVVLGNETTKHDQQIRYADFLNDATRLHALSAMITANNFDAAAAEIAAMRAEARSRFVQEAKEAVAAAQALARESRKSDADSKISELSAILQNSQLTDADRATFNTKFAAVSEQFGVTSAAERAAAAKSQVDAALAEMRSNRDAAARIVNAVDDLKAMNAITLADRANYIQAVEVESKALDRARDGIMGQPMASALAAKADALEMKAAKAMDSQLGLLVVIASALRDIDANIAAARGAQASVAGRSQAYDNALASASRVLSKTQGDFNAQATAGVNAELYALNNYLDSSATQAGAMNPAFANARSAEARSAEARSAEARSAEAKSVEAKSVEARSVEARSVEARSVEARSVEAGARSPELKAFLANLSNQLNSNSALAASLAHRDDMAARAEQMVNHKNAARN